MKDRFRLLAAAGLVATLTAGLVAVAPTAGANPGPPTSAFDPPSAAWALVQDRTSAQFTGDYNSYKEHGFLVVHLEIDNTGDGVRYGAVFQQNLDNRAWRLVRDMSPADYTNERLKAIADGLRLSEFESYEVNGNRRYAAVWVENKEKVEIDDRYDQTADEFASFGKSATDHGLFPIDIEQSWVGGVARFSSLWVTNTAHLTWYLGTDLTGAQFSTKFSAVPNRWLAGYDSVSTAAGQRYSMIMIDNLNGRGAAERRDLTATMFANWVHRYSDEGYRLVNYERYETAGGTRYAGVWRQNSQRPLWAYRAAVDTRLEAEADAYNVPGISLAIIQNGQVQYLRGTGYADVAGGVWMDAEHVLGIASVSKAVAGTLALRLDQEGVLDVDNHVSTYLPGLPGQHTYRVKELASNLGCVEHYGEGSGFGTDTPYTTALSSAQEFWSDPLYPGVPGSPCTVGTPPAHYSTHGYTILCAAFEHETGLNDRDLIEAELTNPFNLGTLRPQRLEDTSARRAKRYADDNSPMAIPDETAKTCGGGMESTVKDVARFGQAMLSGQLLATGGPGTDYLNLAWQPPQGWSYAYGWNNSVVNGHRVIWKDGDNPGVRSFLRIYPDDGLVIAALSNRQNGGHSMRTLTKDIGEMIV